MAAEADKSRLEQIAEVLAAHGVRYIVIGGQAEALHGSPRVTYDVDLCYERTRLNLDRLASALRELKPTLRGAPPDLPFRLDAESLALGCNFTFSTTLGDLDLLGYVEPLGDYQALEERAVAYRLDRIELQVINLDDLITIKQHIRRPKDQAALMQLLAIKRVRQEKGPG